MSVENSLSFKGLVTSPNNLGAGSEGALVAADNVTIRYPDVLEPRRGQETQSISEKISCVVTAPSGSIIKFRFVTFSVPLSPPVTAGQSVFLYKIDGSFDQFTVFDVTSSTAFRIIDSSTTVYLAMSYENVTGPVSQVTFFDGTTFIHIESASQLQRVDGPVLDVAVKAAKPDGFAQYRLKSAVDGRNLHAATDQGIVVIESADTLVPRISGIQAPVLPTGGSLPDVGSPNPPGWLPAGKSVAYRVVFGFKDANNILHLGPPSERVVVTNSSASVPANVRLFINPTTAPKDVNSVILPDAFVQVYRSAIADSKTSTSDVLNLALEETITSAMTSDRFIVVDVAPASFVQAQAPLYTNEEQEGLNQANEPVPYATDVASWNQRLWYANTRQPDFLKVQLLGVVGGGNADLDATGLRINDTITIETEGESPLVLTAAVGNVPEQNEFRLYDEGTPSENISITLENIQLAVADRVRLDNYPIIAYLLTDTTFDIRSNIVFRRLSVAESESTGFTVTYATPVVPCTFQSSSGSTRTFTSTARHYLRVGDHVSMTRTTAGFIPQSIVITAVTTFTFSFVSTYSLITSADRFQREYANTVWNPDLSVGQSSENQRAPERVYYSKVREPEAVPALNYIDVGTAGKAILRIQPQRDRLLVFKEEGTFAIYGDYPFSAALVDDTVQLIAPDSVTAIGSTVFALMDDGVVAITEGAIQSIDEPIDSLLKPYFGSAKLSTTASAFGVGYESEKVFALFMPDLSIAGYGAKAYVYGLASGAWTTWSFPQARLCGKVNPSLDAGFYGLAASPYLVKDRKTSTVEDYRQENNTAIVSTVQWAPTTLGAPSLAKQLREAHFHFREVKQPTGRIALATFSLKTDVFPTGGSMDAWPSGDATLPTGTVIGPSELPLQFRKLVPQAVQRATYFTLGLSASVLSSYWALNGYSLVFEATSERTGTVR